MTLKKNIVVFKLDSSIDIDVNFFLFCLVSSQTNHLNYLVNSTTKAAEADSNSTGDVSLATTTSAICAA